MVAVALMALAPPLVGEAQVRDRGQHEVVELNPLLLDDLDLLKFDNAIDNANTGDSRSNRKAGLMQDITAKEPVCNAAAEGEIGIDFGNSFLLERSSIARKDTVQYRKPYDLFGFFRRNYVTIEEEQLAPERASRAKTPYNAHVYGINALNEKPGVDESINYGQFAKVGNFLIGANHNHRDVRDYINPFDCQVVAQQPWPLRCGHLVELPLHRLGLGLHDGELGGEGLVSAFTSRAQLVQLPLVDDVLRDTHADSGNSQECNNPGGTGSAPSRPISGGLLFLLGAALLKVALDSTDAPRNPAWLLGLAWGFGLLAVAAISVSGSSRHRRNIVAALVPPTMRAWRTHTSCRP